MLDTQLEGKEWLAGGQFTIADIANFSWVFAGPYAGVSRCTPGSALHAEQILMLNTIEHCALTTSDFVSCRPQARRPSQSAGLGGAH